MSKGKIPPEQTIEKYERHTSAVDPHEETLQPLKESPSLSSEIHLVTAAQPAADMLNTGEDQAWVQVPCAVDSVA